MQASAARGNGAQRAGTVRPRPGRIKRTAPSHRPLGPRHDAVGLAGERAFAARYGYPVDEREFARGDGGADFRTYRGTVDVKTYRRPEHLLVEVGKERADLYVLACYDDVVDDATLLGWATVKEVEAATVRDVGGMGVQSRAIAAGALRSLTDLDALFGAWCVGCGARRIGALERRPLLDQPKPADFVTVCADCIAKGWRLVWPI